MLVVAAAPGAALAAEAGLRLALALTLPSRPGPGPAHLAPALAAAPAPTHDPGVYTHTSLYQSHTTTCRTYQSSQCGPARLQGSGCSDHGSSAAL